MRERDSRRLTLINNNFGNDVLAERIISKGPHPLSVKNLDQMS